MFAVTKYWLPVLLFGMSGVTLFGGNITASVFASRFVLQIPFALLAIFFLTVVKVRHGNSGLSYRRFFRWRQIAYGEVLAYRRSSFPTLGYIALNRFVPPWGKIYFVVKGTDYSGSLLNLGEANNMLRSSRRIEGREPHRSSTDEAPMRTGGGPFWLIMVPIGISYAVILTKWLPFVFAVEPWIDGFPQWIALPMRFLLAAATWPWGIISLAILLAALLRGRRDWFLSFMIGALAGRLLLTALR